MKKAIGLTANTSDFRPNLPQTKHLNYFMGTNPIYMAKGGDVKAGIPNYPNVNVTSGFLPMALGFDNGGEANGTISKLLRLFKVLDGDIVKFFKLLKEKFNFSDEEAQNIVNEISSQDAQPPMGAVDVTPQPVAPKETLTPKDTVTATPEPPYGAVDVTPEPTNRILPDNIEQQQRDFEDEQKPSDFVPPPKQVGPINPIPQEKFDEEEGIRGIPTERTKELPFYLKAFDLNGDGEVNIEDYNIAKQKGLAIADAIAKWLGLDEEATPDLPKVTDEQRRRDEQDKQRGIEKIIPEIKPKPDKGGITELPKVSEEQIKRDKEDKQTGLGVEEQKTLKKGADIAAGGVGNTQDKKDAPAWALPLMSAGFAMMASKSPNFLQALGEAGQAGIGTLAEQKKAEQEKLDAESQRGLQEAQRKYYLGEGKQSSTKTVVQDGMLYKSDGTPFYITTPKGEKIHATASLTFEDAMSLAPNYYGIQWDNMDETQRTKAVFALMEMYKNQAAGLNVEDNVGAEIADEGGGLTDWFKDWLGLKDGGIVTIRR